MSRLRAVFLQGDVDDLVFDAGAASVVAPQENNTGPRPSQWSPVSGGWPPSAVCICECNAMRTKRRPGAAILLYFPSNSAFSGSFFQLNVLAKSAGE